MRRIFLLCGDAVATEGLSLFETRQYSLHFFLFIVASFDIYFQETVEEDLFAGNEETLFKAVAPDAHVGLLDAGVGHLVGDGPLPDEVVEFLLRGGAFDVEVADIGRTDGFVGLLGTLDAGVIVARLGIFSAVEFGDGLFGGADGQRREVHGVGTHVGDQTGLVEALGDRHGLADGEPELAGSFLLQGGSGERRSRGTVRFFLFDGIDLELGAFAAFQERAGLLLVVEFAVEGGVDGLLGTFGQEGAFHAEERLAVEGGDFALAVDDEFQGHRLDAAGRELRLDLLPKDGGEFETDESVEHAAGLLGLDQVHVDVARVVDSFEDGRLGNLVEDDAAGLFDRQAEGFSQVPGNGLSFAVFIGSQPDRIRFCGGGAQFGYRLLLVGRNFVLGFETVLDVDTQTVFLQIADVSEAGFDCITFPEKLFNRLGLGRRLHND